MSKNKKKEGIKFDIRQARLEGHIELLPRNHPTKEGHKGWSNLLIKELIQ